MATPLRVLILEDNPSDAELVLHTLRRAGYDPIAELVETEEEYRVHLESAPEIILADFSMPQFDSLRALEIIKERKLDIPFIIVSGTIGEERAVQVMQSGATDYIIKDRLGRLGLAVEQALEKNYLRIETQLAERRLSAQHATTKVLAESPDLEAAIPQIIKAICNSMGWAWAAVWMVDPLGDKLCLQHFWPNPSAGLEEFVSLCREKTFARGEGLPGRVWSEGKPVWAPDVMQEETFYGKHAAARAGIHGAFVCPMLLGQEVVGVIEFLSQRIEQPNEKILEMMAAIGSQIGQFFERKRVEGGLRMFRALIDHTLDGIEVVDPDTGQFLDVNEKSCTAHGYTREEYLGLTVAEIDPLVAASSWASVIGERRQAGTQNFESLHRRKDGSTFPVEVNMNFIHLDRDYLVKVVRDITERKRLEDQFRQAQERLVHVVASSPAMLFTMAIDGNDVRLNWISDNVQAMTGFTASDALRPNWWMESVHPSDRDQLAADIQILIADDYKTHEFRFQHRDGKYHWMRSEMRLLRDAAGEAVEIVGSWSNITEQKLIEAHFRQSQKMDAFGQLAGGVAHDFNNLLTVISGYSEMVLGTLRPEDRNAAMIQEIHNAGERAALLTRQLLAFSRKQMVEPKILDLNGVIANTEKMLRRLIGEDVSLETVLPPDLEVVNIDTGQAEQVVMNLVLNARDAMPRGGTITITTANVVLNEARDQSQSAIKPGRYIVLTVSDTGSGMNEEVRRHLFEPFFTTKEQGKGTGLGLAVVHGVVTQSGGFIEVDSEVNIGTTFKVYLPGVEAAERNGKAPPIHKGAPRGTETILMVEDDEGVRLLTRHMLSDFGYTVLEASDGADALRLAGDFIGTIHLLMTDVVMPGLSGRQVAEGIAGLRPDARVLFVSGYTDDAVVRHGILQNNVNFLPKPFSSIDLACKLREVLDSACPALT